MTDLNKLIATAEAQARRVLIGTKDELVPIWLVETEADQAILLIATPFIGPDAKHTAVAAVRKLMREHQAVAYSFLVETWYADAPGKDAGAALAGLPPSQRPDRKEAVMALAEAKDGRKTGKMWEIKRGEDGACVDLVALDIDPAHGVTTTFSGMFGETKQ